MLMVYIDLITQIPHRVTEALLSPTTKVASQRWTSGFQLPSLATRLSGVNSSIGIIVHAGRIMHHGIMYHGIVHHGLIYHGIAHDRITTHHMTSSIDHFALNSSGGEPTEK